jgi:transcriptional regulator GlxA family with amidase domain
MGGMTDMEAGPAPETVMFVQRNLRRKSKAEWQELAKEANYQVAALAELVGCCPKQLGRFFQKHTGMGPQKWMRLMRVKRSTRELKEKTVKATALAAGFKHVSQFCRVFKSVFGITPGEAAMGVKPKMKKPKMGI